MRNEKITAYSLHHRNYQDKRSLYYLLTKEFGVMHGVGKRGVSQFVPLTLMATGKKSLKNLTQMTVSQTVGLVKGQQQYAGLYINEITLKLLAIEDPVPTLYNYYLTTLNALRQPLTGEQLRLVLRHYEKSLFDELGFSIELYVDCNQQDINESKIYRFIVDQGWLEVSTKQLDVQRRYGSSSSIAIANGSNLFEGQSIIDMRSEINSHNLANYSLLHRQLIDYLFDYNPLQSRLLWQQFNQYQ